MKITSIKIENFRLLDNIEINLEDITTAVVGKNNSGKTSFSEIFNIFMNSRKFEFEDFSINSHQKFKDAYEIYLAINDENRDEKGLELIKATPKIQLLLDVTYLEEDTWTNIKPFISSLEENDTIKVLFEHTPKNTEKFFQIIKSAMDKNSSALLDEIKILFSSHYKTVIRPYSESENMDEVDFSDVEKLLQCHFIEAQRDLEDSKSSNTKLSSIFQKEYDYRTKNEDNSSDELIEVTDTANEEIEEKLNIFFKDFVDSFKEFGFPGIDNERLELQSNIVVENLFKNNVRLVYNHDDNILPEKYNGLGYKNLMYIISKILSFEILHQDKKCDLNLLFIEEPEAHMHPQMQRVFIENITNFLRTKNFNVQVVITTHSSHILTNTEFESIRYFSKNSYSSTIKDLKKFSNDLTDPQVLEFLKQYLTLDKSELFFADKAILFEGVVERLLMPVFIKKLDIQSGTNLSEQYISYIEIGGAYMNKFKELLEFLDIKTLIITDIDSIDVNNSRKKVEITDNATLETSNVCLKQWLPQQEKIQDLLGASNDEKIDNKIRVAYQTKLDEEALKCGRSFEEAFVLDNLEYVLDKKEQLLSMKNKLSTYSTIEEIKQNSYDIAKSIKKTDFAFDLLSNQDNFDVPNYIKEGLLWLSQH
jgi:predicted ATP-dependent endonuclease of OLD family